MNNVIADTGSNWPTRVNQLFILVSAMFTTLQASDTTVISKTYKNVIKMIFIKLNYFSKS